MRIKPLPPLGQGAGVWRGGHRTLGRGTQPLPEGQGCREGPPNKYSHLSPPAFLLPPIGRTQPEGGGRRTPVDGVDTGRSPKVQGGRRRAQRHSGGQVERIARHFFRAGLRPGTRGRQSTGSTNEKGCFQSVGHTEKEALI